MLLFVFVAIVGGIATGAAIAPFGLAFAIIAAPFGGSLCALCASLAVMSQRKTVLGSDENISAMDLDVQADSMVADLRKISAQAQRMEAKQPVSEQSGRHVA